MGRLKPPLSGGKDVTSLRVSAVANGGMPGCPSIFTNRRAGLMLPVSGVAHGISGDAADLPLLAFVSPEIEHVLLGWGSPTG